MGWKTSMVLIENRYGFNDETALLKAIGKANYEFDKEVSFEECLYPNDESINIGYYNNTLIICDDYQITQQTIELSNGLNLMPQETALVSLFPHAEILSVACHSVSNFHGYALIRRGLKTRVKMAVDGECIAHGEPFQEELEIYKNSYLNEISYILSSLILITFFIRGLLEITYGFFGVDLIVILLASQYFFYKSKFKK